MEITPEELRSELTRLGRFTPAEVEDLIRRAEQNQREREAAKARMLGLGEQLSRSSSEQRPVDADALRSQGTDMDDGWRSSVDNRLGELKGAIDGLRHSFTILAGAVGLVATVMVFGFGFFGLQFNRLDGRIDQLGNKIELIPQHLSEEFRAMRTEMAAQTSAIANSITATHQAQPTPPQIIVIPEPTASTQRPPPG
jgi:hypothetical protein